MNNLNNVDNVNSISNLAKLIGGVPKEKFESLIWLLGTGPIASGRTYIMALVFVIISLTEKRPVKLFSHDPAEGAEFILREIERIMKKCPDLSIEVKQSGPLSSSYGKRHVEISVTYKKDINYNNNPYDYKIRG